LLTVVGSILLSTNQHFGVKELAVWTGSNFVDWLLMSVSVEYLGSILTEGSKSTKIDRGTYFPFPVSVNMVSDEPGSVTVVSGSARPSILRPCSRRYLVFWSSLVFVWGFGYSQLPGTVSELGTRLANV
jgi:hypothetical protein